MINQPTIDKLHAMRLSAMADAFRSQDGDSSYDALSFNDRFGILVDSEYQKRRTSKLQKSIKMATFRYPDACVENIEYHADRQLDKSQILQLSTCRYIHDGHHIILGGVHSLSYPRGLYFMKSLVSIREPSDMIFIWITSDEGRTPSSVI